MNLTRSACALSRSSPSSVSQASCARCARIRRTASGCRANQRANAVPGANAAEQRLGLALRHDLSVLEGAQRAGFHVLAARQADFGPQPVRIGLAAGDVQPQAAGGDRHILDLQRHLGCGWRQCRQRLTVWRQDLRRAGEGVMIGHFLLIVRSSAQRPLPEFPHA
jgi:hypothetical protein